MSSCFSLVFLLNCFLLFIGQQYRVALHMAGHALQVELTGSGAQPGGLAILVHSRANSLPDVGVKRKQKEKEKEKEKERKKKKKEKKRKEKKRKKQTKERRSETR